VRTTVQQGFCLFPPSQEDAMLAVQPTGAEPDTQRPAPTQAVVERGLRSSRYAALKHVSCDYRGGVLLLPGRLPIYYLKQIAQEAVAHQRARRSAWKTGLKSSGPPPR
jgi:hypothetical protein